MPRLLGARRARRNRLAARVVLISIVCVTVAIPADAAPGGWLRPVPGAVVRPYQEPIARYAAGHRGVDFAAASGTPVRAANDGRVTFAGSVAGSLHVVVAHEGGIRTSYSFLSRIDVRTGGTVRRGNVVGAAGGSGEGHGPGVLHLGARIGDRYIDPMLLFGPTDLTQLVRLVPASERAAAGRAAPEEEERDLFRSFFYDDDDGCAGGFLGKLPGANELCEAISTAVGWTADLVGDVLEVGLDVLEAAGAAGEWLVRKVQEGARELIANLPKLAGLAIKLYLNSTPLGKVLLIALAVGKVVYDYATQDCDADAPPANGKGGSGNWVLAVGGIDTDRGRHEAGSFAFEWKRLGYEPEDVEWFSYRDGSETYSKEDTYKRVVRDAALLAEQLRSEAREHPGRPVDLVGHSLGGRVIRAFLEYHWKGHADEYPRIDHVVFFASPQNGTPGADVAQALRVGPFDVALQAIDAVAPGPDLTSPALEDLAESSEQSRYFATHAIPEGVKALSIAGSFDWVVPPGSPKIKGGLNFVTNVGDWHPADDHSGILHDDEALSAARAFMEDRKLPCMGFGDTAMNALGSAVIGETLRVLGDEIDRKLSVL